MKKVFKLKGNHPTLVKYNKLIEFADALGLHLEFDSGVCLLRDLALPNNIFKVEDIEGGDITGFPHPTETKITFEVDESTGKQETPTQVNDSDKDNENT